MTSAQRQSLETMFSTLMGAELDVQGAYVRWTASLRRVLTRAAHGQHARLLSLSSMALEAAAEWVAADPHSRGRELDADVLGVGVLGVEDVSQMQLWRDAGPQNVTVTVTAGGGQLPAGERAALRLAAGTSPKAVAKRINDLVAEHGVVTAAEVFERTPAEFQRLGSLVMMLDLAVQYGTIDPEMAEQVTLGGKRRTRADGAAAAPVFPRAHRNPHGVKVMSRPRPGTSDDTGMGGEVEPEHLDDPAGNRLPEPGRRALVSLLMNRYVSRTRHRIAWEGILTYENDLRARLDEMYLDLIVDHEAEVAFKRQQDGDDVPRMLRREKALTRDASFVLIFLRREYAFADPDDGPVMITRDQVGEFLRAYREDGDGDDARFSRRVDAAINALIKPWQILEPDPAVDYLFTISPVVVPLVGVDEMRRLEAAFRQAVAAPGSSSSPDGEVSDSFPGSDEERR